MYHVRTLFPNHQSVEIAGCIQFPKERGELKFSSLFVGKKIISVHTHIEMSYIIWVETTIQEGDRSIYTCHYL